MKSAILRLSTDFVGAAWQETQHCRQNRLKFSIKNGPGVAVTLCMKGCPDSGVTLVEVLVSTAVASIALAGAAGLLAASARAVADSELETTAIWVASRTIEEWRSQATPPADGSRQLDRDGSPAVGPGLLQATWTANAESGGTQAWRVTVAVTSRRLRQAITAEAVVQRAPW